MNGKTRLGMITVIAGVILLGGLSASSTYAMFYKSQSSSKAESYKTGNLAVTSTGGSVINVNQAYPRSDAEGQSMTPYTVTVKNTGTTNYQFDIVLINNSAANTGTGGSHGRTTSKSGFNHTVTSTQGINTKYIKTLVNGTNDSAAISGSARVLSSCSAVSGLANSFVLTSTPITLAAGKTATVKVYVWYAATSDTAQSNDIGKKFRANIKVRGIATDPNQPTA